MKSYVRLKLETGRLPFAKEKRIGYGKKVRRDLHFKTT